MYPFLDARVDTRNREIRRLDTDMHHDNGETFGMCFVDQSKFRGM